MASHRAIATGLALLHESFPTRPITPDTADVFGRLFATAQDDAFIGACVMLAKQPGRVFFPTPGELEAALHPEPIDVDRLLSAIESLGHYLPNAGWTYPRAEVVRERFGDAIAGAYASAGGSRCYSENDTSRDIARREFAAALSSTPKAQLTQWLIGAKPERLALPPPPPRRLTGPAGPVWTPMKALAAVPSPDTSPQDETK